ncbi:MAG: hypothetical protein A2W27_04775 [Deltaproteobacteria bacterium RBG_16_44_11]|nr:MAG: hypothetical protein A2W27_04775 [Deltaproteobacteria bacterium RBG_16_44_11]
MSKKNCLMVLIIILTLMIFNHAFAQTCVNGEEPPCDEEATFVSVAPDALFLIDFSGSMAWNPAGGDHEYGHDLSCTANTTYCGTDSDPANNGFRASSVSGCSVNCSRLAILKRAMFNILDDDNTNDINNNDSISMNVRLGYMRYRNGDDMSGAYGSGNIRLVRGIGSAYQQIYCLASATTGSCASTQSTCKVTGECIVGTSASGGTPLAAAIREAKTYLDYHKSLDNAKDCRQKFLIVLTDGADTYACNGEGAECGDYSYDRRRATVSAVKALKDAGYKVFVVGFGSTMPAYLQNNLNWMAFYGGTDNSLIVNAGDTIAYNPDNNPAGYCPATVDPPAELTSSGTCQGDTYTDWFAQSNDPGNAPLSGYAFIAGDATALTLALRTAINVIQESIYTFSQASVQAVRTQDEDFLYEASFQPVNDDPFWIGHLSKYEILANGDIASSSMWDAGAVLSTEMSASDRVMFTLKGGAKTTFDTTNILAADVAAADDTERNLIVNFIRGGETSPDVTNWRLGDIFHSFPVTIGTPSPYYFDKVDKSEYICPNPDNPYQRCKAFDLFREDHPRESSNGKRLIVIGANDGQLHAFKTSNGHEAWSFIPPNFRPRLKMIAHAAHPTADNPSLLGHQYFMDGFISYAEVWLGTGTGESKNKNDWNTLMIAGEGRGGMTNLWSQSSSCDSDFNEHYATTDDPPVYYPNYCGYYAFNLTANTENPLFSWRIGSNTALSADEAKHLGQPWSKMIMSRVIIGVNEKWVGFIGGGYSGNNCTTGTCDTSGKGFYVIDLMNGNVLWSYTHDKNNNLMAYDVAANPAIVDTDNDGFADTAYIGDLGNNVWRIKFCLKKDTSCGISQWAGGMLFSGAGARRPVFYMNAVTKDTDGNLWVHFGTGDKTDPTFVPTDGTKDRFFAIIDKDRDSTTAIAFNTLKNILSSGNFVPATDVNNFNGWVLDFLTPGEKMLAESTVFMGAIYFTTYTPGSASDPCDQGGTAKLYAINYVTGAGLFSGGARSTDIGSGIPSAPIVSIGPTGIVSVYASTSQTGTGSGSATKQQSGGTPPQACLIPPCPPRPQDGGPWGHMYYWRDNRLQ